MKPRQARISPNDQTTRKHRPDYGLFVSASVLLTIGLVVMYAISPALAAQGGDVSDNYFVTRQLIAIIIGLMTFWVVSKISIEKWVKISKPLLVIAILACISTIALGAGGIGNRWIEVGPLSFQPVELLKLAVIVTFAAFLTSIIESGNMQNYKEWRYALAVMAVIAAIVVVIHKDLGSTMVLFSIILAMLYMAGFPILKFFVVMSLVAILGVLAITSTPYRRDRVATFLNPTKDCQEEGYHACQALIAVGSGGVMGVGLGKSIQAYGYLPEAENDSIFAIYAEKFGFIGSVALISIYGYLLLLIANIMRRSPTRTAMLICAGIFAWFMVQGTINMAAMLGLMPLKGITLPFVSYGGSSLVFSMAALGLVFHISKYTNLGRVVAFEQPNTQKEDVHESNANRRGDRRPRYTVTRRSL